MAGYHVSVETRQPFAGAPGLVRLATRVLAAEGVPDRGSVSILLADDKEMRRLNRKFRRVDRATDVLSFAGSPAGFIDPPPEGFWLGDIAIGVGVAARQAARRKVPLEAEVQHLLVHALLHLCGHHHEGGEEETAVWRREETYLGDLSAFHKP